MGAMFGLDGRAAAAGGRVLRAGAGDRVRRPTRPASHHTPGHCPGGVCLQIGKTGTAGRELFVGDTLFAGSIGRTDLPGGDYDTLIASIRNVLFRSETMPSCTRGMDRTRPSARNGGRTRFLLMADR